MALSDPKVSGRPSKKPVRVYVLGLKVKGVGFSL